MAINFPDNPINGQTITVGAVLYTYNSVKQYWRSLNAGTGTTIAPTAGLPIFGLPDYLMLMGI